MVVEKYAGFLFATLFLFSNHIFAEQSPLERWVSRYDGSENHINEARDLAIDSAGNVYVTGICIGGEDNYDYVTVKYNSAGNQLWAKCYDAATETTMLMPSPWIIPEMFT